MLVNTGIFIHILLYPYVLHTNICQVMHGANDDSGTICHQYGVKNK